MTQFILDTNYYRNIVAEKSINQIRDELNIVKKLKNKKKFKSVFSNIVSIELINHLLDNNQTSEICFKALYYLINDANQNEGLSFKGQIVPTIHDLATLYLFKEKSQHFRFNDNIIKIAHLVAQNGKVDDITTFKNEIKQIIDFKNQELKNIIKNIENNYLRPLNEKGNVDWYIFKNNSHLKTQFENLVKKKSFHKLFCFSLVQMAVNETKKRYVEISLKGLENGLSKDFEVSIDFFVKKIWKKLVDIEKKEYFFRPELDPQQRWNSFYDLQLIFATEYENSFGRKTILVTQDKIVRKLFEKHNKSKLVMDIDNYNILINN